MGLRDVISVLRDIPTLLTLKKGLKPRDPSERDCIARMVEINAERFGDRTAILFEGLDISWRDFNALANRYAHQLQQEGVNAGDSIALFMENRIDYLALIIALNKLGASASLINSNLTGKPLAHCVGVTGSRKCIVGEELIGPIADIMADLDLNRGTDYLFVADGGTQSAPDWARDLGRSAAEQPDDNPAASAEQMLGANALYIFTSGTTGLPKAAKLSNRRYLSTAKLAHLAGLRCTEQDRLYLCLPLYHATGLMVGFGAAMSSGAGTFVRRRFSASQFLPEVREHGTTCLIYIGELCRYLVNSEHRADDADNPLRAMMGNGLRPDVWMRFKERFGVHRITEFYGSSEGNVAFANLFNKDMTIGLTSNEIALVRYDVDDDRIESNADGRLIPVEPGEPGLLIARIHAEAVFEGYTDPEATEKKILRNVFAEGDAWFNTGDLIREVDAGFSLGYAHYQFVDRVGDTFRWKSENVSTNEVGEILSGFPDIQFCNVYGVEVPGADGRAGMAAITLAEGVEALDLNAFADYVNAELPAYARPVFLRLQHHVEVTGTFKLMKGDLRKAGYDAALCEDPLYVMKPGSSRYEPLTTEFYETLQAGNAGY